MRASARQGSSLTGLRSVEDFGVAKPRRHTSARRLVVPSHLPNLPNITHSILPLLFSLHILIPTPTGHVADRSRPPRRIPDERERDENEGQLPSCQSRTSSRPPRGTVARHYLKTTPAARQKIQTNGPLRVAPPRLSSSPASALVRSSPSWPSSPLACAVWYDAIIDLCSSGSKSPPYTPHGQGLAHARTRYAARNKSKRKLPSLRLF